MPVEMKKLAPDLGQHTEEVLIMEILGYSWEQLAVLRDAEAYWRKRREREQGKSVRARSLFFCLRKETDG